MTLKRFANSLLRRILENIRATPAKKAESGTK